MPNVDGMRMRVRLGICVLAIAAAMPASAQTTEPDTGALDYENPVQQSVTPVTPSGSVARTSAGQAGRRQTREEIEQQTGIDAMARINSRVQNRVQSRLRNRIDGNYDPAANATRPFEAAEGEVRRGSRPRR